MSKCKGARRQAEWTRRARGGSTSTAWPKQAYLAWISLVLALLPVVAFAGVAEYLTQAEGLVQGRQYDQAEKIHKAVVEQATDQDRQLAVQRGLVLLHIAANQTSAADGAYQQMLERFTGNAGLPQAVYEIGRGYKEAKQTDKAFQIYQSVIQKWKDTEWGIHSQRDIIHSHLDRSDDKAANAAVDTLLADFSQHKDIAGTIYNLGKHYRNLRRSDISLKLHQYNVEHYANALQGMYSQVEIIKSAISRADDAAADQEFGRLVQVFSGQAALPTEVYQVGAVHSKAGRHDRAEGFYQYVLDHWPDSDAAVRAQVAILDKESPPGTNTTVEEAFGRLIEAFSQNGTPAKEVYHTAMGYRQTRPVQARQVHQYNAEQSSKDDQYAMWSQTEVAKSWILEGNEKAAEGAGNRLMTVLAGQSTLPTELCRVGDAYLQAGKPDKAEQVYKYVLDHTAKGDGQLIWPRAGMVKLDMACGRQASARQALDALLAKFKDHPDAGKAVFGIGAWYWDRALAEKAEGLGDRGASSFREALAVFDKAVKELPQARAMPEIYFFAAECQRRIGQYREALQYYQEVLDTWPDYEHAGIAQHRVAMTYKRLADTGGISESDARVAAQRALERLVAKYPNCTEVASARVLLEEYARSVGGGTGK